NPSAVKTWFSQRRAFMVAQLNALAANFAITSNSGNDFATNSNIISLSGTAPIEVKGIRVNGVEYPVTWTSVTNWSLRLVLGAGQNSITLEGYDPSGTVLTNHTDSINITYNGTVGSPDGQVVINE